MQLALLLLILASCTAATRSAKVADDAEWGIFAALRNAQSAGDTSSDSCSCCQDVQDLRKRIAALEHDVFQIAGQMISSASQCPSIPDLAAASAAAESAEPTLARMQATYCSEWVRINRPQIHAHAFACPLTQTLHSISGRAKRRRPLPSPTANECRSRSALVGPAAVRQRLRQRRRFAPSHSSNVAHICDSAARSSSITGISCASAQQCASACAVVAHIQRTTQTELCFASRHGGPQDSGRQRGCTVCVCFSSSTKCRTRFIGCRSISSF